MGFVGLTTAAVFAEKKITVYGVDNDKNKASQIASSKAPFFEPDLEHVIRRTVNSGKLIPTTDLLSSISKSEIVFVCVGTPMKPDGSVNLDYIKKVSTQIGQAMKSVSAYPIICVKSTVPPGTTERIITKLIQSKSGKTAGQHFGIAMTPEFLREGSAVSDMRTPHLIVIGSSDENVQERMSAFFRKIYGTQTKMITTNTISAELIKYANNSFLATKISFINTIANVCNRIAGADVDRIADAIGSDPRIGNLFLKAGPGYGGSCFPKDVSGFIHYCKQIGYDPVLLKATDLVNRNQINIILEILNKELGKLEDKSISILGTAFKKDTDDIRESVSIKLVNKLKKARANIHIHDPMALENTRLTLGNNRIYYFSDISSAINSADCIILMTDWDEYKRINEKTLSMAKDACLIIDTRRILKFNLSARFRYIALGRS